MSEQAGPGAGADEAEPEDPAGSVAVTSRRSMEIAVYIALLAFAAVMAFDNVRTGIGWASDGPRAGYFPFYLSLILAAASLYGLAKVMIERQAGSEAFVTRGQLRRVMQVFLPTLLFCLLTQWLGLYVASFLLVAGFMRFVGRIALWKCLLTSFLFALSMFITFQIMFDVIMPKGPLEALFGY
jgi:putative tricarboxylic transport membrane protein